MHRGAGNDARVFLSGSWRKLAKETDSQAWAGQVKSSGFRTLVATWRQQRWVFVFGFAKNARSNISPGEHEALKKLAHHLLSLNAENLKTALVAGELIEVECHDEKEKVGHS